MNIGDWMEARVGVEGSREAGVWNRQLHPTRCDETRMLHPQKPSAPSNTAKERPPGKSKAPKRLRHPPGHSSPKGGARAFDLRL